MSGPESEYSLEDCPKGKKDLKTGKTQKVAYDNRGKCDKSEHCALICEHRKK